MPLAWLADFNWATLLSFQVHTMFSRLRDPKADGQGTELSEGFGTCRALCRASWGPLRPLEPVSFVRILQGIRY